MVLTKVRALHKRRNPQTAPKSFGEQVEADPTQFRAVKYSAGLFGTTLAKLSGAHDWRRFALMLLPSASGITPITALSA